MFTPADLFDLTQTEHGEVFAGCQYAWEALTKIKPYVLSHCRSELRNRCEGTAYIGKQVCIGEGTLVEDGAMIKGPAIIGCNCQIRHNAYIREAVIVGDNCVVGNACEVKNALLFNQVQVAHFNYVGDSILGYRSHLGAGVILSNYKVLSGTISVEMNGQPFNTGLRKFGALLGDGAEVGCNAVLNPGSILGRGAVVYPNLSWRGILPANMIAKGKAELDMTVRRPRSE